MSLYSEKGRRALSFARPIVREFAKDVSSSEMRKARHKYIQMDKGSNLPASNAYRLYKFFDFYNLSMFRDLLFHVQEVEFNIPKIFDILNQLGMRFCGFYDPDGKIMKSYRHYMPHDPMGRDPQSWDKFETLDPDAFSSLYDFVIQKPLYH